METLNILTEDQKGTPAMCYVNSNDVRKFNWIDSSSVNWTLLLSLVRDFLSGKATLCNSAESNATGTLLVDDHSIINVSEDLEWEELKSFDPDINLFPPSTIIPRIQIKNVLDITSPKVIGPTDISDHSILDLELIDRSSQVLSTMPLSDSQIGISRNQNQLCNSAEPNATGTLLVDDHSIINVSEDLELDEVKSYDPDINPFPPSTIIPRIQYKNCLDITSPKVIGPTDASDYSILDLDLIDISPQVISAMPLSDSQTDISRNQNQNCLTNRVKRMGKRSVSVRGERIIDEEHVDLCGTCLIVLFLIAFIIGMWTYKAITKWI